MIEDHEISSGNVFSDLGFEDSEQEMLKAKLTFQIFRLIKERGLSQAEAARLLETTQPQVSALMRCKPTSVSVGRLLKYLTALDHDVEVVVKPARHRNAGGRLSVAYEEQIK